MRILFLALDLCLELDQAECIHVREIVRNMANLGHEVLLLSSSDSSWNGDGAYPGFSVRKVGGGRTLGELVRVLRESRRFRPDVVYERRFLPKMGAAVSTVRGIPGVVEINGLVDEEIKMQGRTPNSILPTGIAWPIHGMVFSRMSKIVTVTKGLARSMSIRYRIPEDRLTVVENAANVRIFRPLDKIECRRRIGLKSNWKWICFEGGLYPWHGVSTALHAVKILREQDLEIGLLVVGDGPCRGELEVLAADLGLADRVLFFGEVPYAQVPDFIGACDVGVGPFTRARNVEIGISPMKIYEYVACGRPVVSSRLPGIGEWIEANKLGLLAEPDNPGDFAAKLSISLRDQESQREMIFRGPRAVTSDHSWESVASHLATICESLLGEKKKQVRARRNRAVS